MKKFATAAVAATMALALAVPTANAAEDKGSSLDDAVGFTTVVSGNTCEITSRNGATATLTRDEVQNIVEGADESKIADAHDAYLRGDADSTLKDFDEGEYYNAYKACADGQNYTTSPVNSLSSVVESHEGRAAAYWLSIIVPTLIGIAALGAAFSPEFRHMLPAPVQNLLNTYLK